MAVSIATRNMLVAQFKTALDDAAAADDGTLTGARRATDASFQCKAIAERAVEAFRRSEDGKDAD